MLVPKLRFREFYDDWIIYKFYDLVTITNGQVNPNDMLYCNLPHIGPGNIEKNTGRLLQYNLAKDDKLISNKYLFDEKSVIYGKINPQFAKVCFPKFRGLCSADAYPLNPSNDKLNSAFLLYLLLNKNFTKFAISVSMRTGMPKINREELSMYKFKVPSIIEQEKIANFLSLLDKKIELQQRKIEALKIYKKGLMQKLINSNNCEEKSVSEFGTIITGTTPSKLIHSYWNNGTIAWITPSDITEGKDVYNSHDMLTPDGLKAGRFVPAGSVLITCIASIGKNAILKIDGSCNQQINAIIPNKNFNADYLYYLFEMKKDYLQSTAGTSATSIINKSSFEKLAFKVPKLEEQNKISKILNCLELKIENEKLKFEKLTFLKKSLLQQMFI